MVKRHVAVSVEGRPESEIVAAQDQALQSKYRAIKILHTETGCTCRLCQQVDDRIDSVI